MEENKIEDLRRTDVFLIPKPMIIFNFIHSRKSCIISDIGFDLRMTYSHVANTVTTFKKLGLVTKTKEGRTMKVELTKEGEELAKVIAQLIFLLKK